jgi:Protein of unknown function (DUF2778)
VWQFVQQTGELLHDGEHVAFGYSGRDEGKNNPALEAEHNVGPIPHGVWTIEGPPFDSPEHGPFCMRLIPSPDVDTYGRIGFLMHGDSIEHPGCASMGCMILARRVRELVWNSGDLGVLVIADKIEEV